MSVLIRSGLTLSALALALAMLFAGAPSAAISAGGYTVNSTADGVDANPGDGVCATAAGACTLRAAIQESNALAGPHTITLPPGTFTLSIPGAAEDAAATGDLDITNDLTIEGAPTVNNDPAGVSSEPTSIIDGGGIDRVFHVIGTIAVQMSNVVIRNGNVSGDFALGGGIFNPFGTVALSNSRIDSNHAYGGGAIYNSGTMTLNAVSITANSSSTSGGGIDNGGGIFHTSASLLVVDSTLDGNSAEGSGGIFNGADGSVTIKESEISGNRVSGNAGGIFNLGKLEMTDSAVGGNEAFSFGGGIEQAGEATLDAVTIFDNTGRPGGAIDQGGGTTTVINSTLSGNHAPAEPGPFGRVPGTGGAIRVNSGQVNLESVTVAHNRADDSGGGIHVIGGEITLTDTIVADNTANPGVENCAGPVTSGGHNLENGNTCGFSASGDLSNVDPLLGLLIDNGGPTLTHALRAGSPAIDAGSPGCPPPATDQRGTARPQGAGCDIGAFEVVRVQRVWGDLRCAGGVDASDSLADLLRIADATALSQTQPCPHIGSSVEVQGFSPHTWGDVDCSGTIDAQDILRIERFVAGLPVTKPASCPAIGDSVVVS